MSEVRMCDKCGTIFSILQEGWQTMSIQDRAASGMQSIMRAYDLGPECSDKATPDVKLPTVKALEAANTTPPCPAKFDFGSHTYHCERLEGHVGIHVASGYEWQNDQTVVH